MDTGTHLVMGLGLAGLAHLDPIVADNANVAAAVLAGTVIGQQAPDLDTIMRLRGNAAYIKHHRGISHSIPAVIVWTLLITVGLSLFFRDLPLWHIAGWVGLAVAVHVLSDMFNAYGTQSLRPFTNRWVAWNIIHIFDPFLFGAHLVAIVLWALKIAPPGQIFGVLYVFLVAYYLLRTIEHTYWVRQLPQLDREHERDAEYMLIPTVRLHKWNVLKKRADNSFALGELRSGQLFWIDSVRCMDHPAIDVSRHHPDIEAFLSFTNYVCGEVIEHEWGYEVRWADIRCRHRKNYPFVAVLLLDRSFQPLDSYVGWISEARMIKRLGTDTAG